MEWLANLFGGDNGSPMQLVLITFVLVASLTMIVWIVRRVAGSPARKASRGRVPRLSITDSASVDDKRYLVLVRRDNVEHLVMIGGPSDIVIESGIERVRNATVQDAPESAQSIQNRAMPEDNSLKMTSPATTPAGKTPTHQPSQGGSKPVSAGKQEQPAPARAVAKPATAAAPIAAVAAATASATTQPEKPDVSEDATKALDDAMQNISLDELDPEAGKDPAVTADAGNDVMLEESISESLNAALSEEDFGNQSTAEADVAPIADAPQSATPEPQVAETGSKSGPDDEMQRLLEELAGETREKA